LVILCCVMLMLRYVTLSYVTLRYVILLCCYNSLSPAKDTNNSSYNLFEFSPYSAWVNLFRLIQGCHGDSPSLFSTYGIFALILFC
jgi:hypothetical protein